MIGVLPNDGIGGLRKPISYRVLLLGGYWISANSWTQVIYTVLQEVRDFWILISLKMPFALYRHRGQNWIKRTTFPTECITMLVVDSFLGEETAVDQDGLSQVFVFS